MNTRNTSWKCIKLHSKPKKPTNNKFWKFNKLNYLFKTFQHFFYRNWKNNCKQQQKCSNFQFRALNLIECCWRKFEWFGFIRLVFEFIQSAVVISGPNRGSGKWASWVGCKSESETLGQGQRHEIDTPASGTGKRER